MKIDKKIYIKDKKFYICNVVALSEEIIKKIIQHLN